MALSDQEAVASLKLLVAVAMADGTLQKEERESLEAAIGGVPLPKGATLQSLLDEKPNVDALIGQFTSPEARESAYQAAYALAYADGACSAEELALLDNLKAKLNVSKEKAGLLGRVFQEARDTVSISSIAAISDPAKRKAEIQEDVIKYSTLSAVLGANPLPLVSIATDLAVVGLQTKMFLDIGQYYGQRLLKSDAKAFLAGVGVSTGARIAVTNLLKIFPGVGSVVGAATSFAATFALGKVAEKYFDGGMKAKMEDLKKDFKNAEKEGKQAYELNKAQIDATKKENEAKIKSLAEELKAGKITQEQYQQKVADLAK